MQFTFGIITDGKNDQRIPQVIQSIERNNIPNYEIIIVGGSPYMHRRVRYIPFDESTKTSWITKKKNLITLNASFENIVFLHDYITLEPNWYQGYLKFGNNFDICINPLLNPDGSRYRDLSFFPAFRDLKRLSGYDVVNSAELYHEVPNMGEHECLIPYENFKPSKQISQWMYISGAYWVAKRHVMVEYPLYEKLSWGQGEDVLWSEMVKQKYIFNFNPFSVCRLLKHKDPIFKILTPETITHLQNRGVLK